MTTTDTETVAARVDAHLKAAAPVLLGLAQMVTTNSAAVSTPAAVARCFIDHPAPDELVAKGLRLLAETAHDLADELDP